MLPEEPPAPSISAKVQAEEVDIFADLLGVNANQVISAATTSTSSSNQPYQFGDGLKVTTETPCLQVTTLGEESVILRENNLQDFLVVNNCLVTCALVESGWILSVYKLKTLLTSVDGSGDKMAGPSCKGALVHQTYFPGSDTIQRSDISCSGFVKATSPVQSTNCKPCLKCVISKSMQVRPSRGSTPNKLLVVDDHLYNGLFGADSNLLDSPVVVLGLPDGRVYQMALKSLRNQVAEVESQSLGTKTRSDVLDGMNENMLYDLQEGFVDIITLDCKNNHDEKSDSQCLVFLGQQGKLVTAMHSPSETNQVQYDEHCISGPVTSSCSTTTHVVYSTPRALVAVAVKGDGKTGSVERKGQKCAIVIRSLAVGRVCALQLKKSETLENNGEWK